MIVIKMPSSKSSIEQFGSPDAFLQQLQSMGLFGKQAYTGEHAPRGCASSRWLAVDACICSRSAIARLVFNSTNR